MGPQDIEVLTTFSESMSGIASAYTDYNVAKNEAAYLEAQANAEFAKGTAEAREKTRLAQKMMGDARAAMAASGGVTTDPGAVDQLAEIEGAGEYNAMVSLFDAQSKADALRYKASSEKYKSQQAARDTLATVITGATNTYDSYKKWEKEKKKKPGKTFEQNWWD